MNRRIPSRLLDAAAEYLRSLRALYLLRTPERRRWRVRSRPTTPPRTVQRPMRRRPTILHAPLSVPRDVAARFGSTLTEWTSRIEQYNQPEVGGTLASEIVEQVLLKLHTVAKSPVPENRLQLQRCVATYLSQAHSSALRHRSSHARARRALNSIITTPTGDPPLRNAIRGGEDWLILGDGPIVVTRADPNLLPHLQRHPGDWPRALTEAFLAYHRDRPGTTSWMRIDDLIAAMSPAPEHSGEQNLNPPFPTPSSLEVAHATRRCVQGRVDAIVQAPARARTRAVFEWWWPDLECSHSRFTDAHIGHLADHLNVSSATIAALRLQLQQYLQACLETHQ